MSLKQTKSLAKKKFRKLWRIKRLKDMRCKRGLAQVQPQVQLQEPQRKPVIIVLYER